MGKVIDWELAELMLLFHFVWNSTAVGYSL